MRGKAPDEGLAAQADSGGVGRMNEERMGCSGPRADSSVRALVKSWPV